MYNLLRLWICECDGLCCAVFFSFPCFCIYILCLFRHGYNRTDIIINIFLQENVKIGDLLLKPLPKPCIDRGAVFYVLDLS